MVGARVDCGKYKGCLWRVLGLTVGCTGLSAGGARVVCVWRVQGLERRERKIRGEERDESG